jgi:hypothetical protein
VQAGRSIKRIAVAYEAGRDGFWLARWLRARGPIEEGGLAFMLLLAEEDENFLFRIKRNDLVILEQAIAQAPGDTGGVFRRAFEK